MIKLGLSSEPAWTPIIGDVAFLLNPMNTTMMLAARRHSRVIDLPEDAPREVVVFQTAVAFAELAIEDWRGVADAAGDKAEITPAHVEEVMQDYAVFTAFQAQYLAKTALIAAEKKFSGPLQNGTSPEGTDIAASAPTSAKNAPTRSTPRKPSKASPSGVS